MKQRIAVLVLILTVGRSASFAQTSSSAFLLIKPTAQSAALGAGALLLRGVNAIGSNPAGLSMQHKEAFTHFQQFPLDTRYASAAGALSIKSLTLGVSYGVLQSAHFDRRDESGEVQGQFKSEDKMTGLHAAGQIVNGRFPILAGLSVKRLESSVDQFKGSSWAYDAGLQAAFPTPKLSAGLSVLNLGSGMQLDQKKTPLPLTYSAALGYQVAQPVNLVAGVSQLPRDHKTVVSFSVQGDIGNSLSLRGRYDMRSGASAGLENLAGGIGLRFGNQRLDYAFQPYDSALRDAGLSGTHTATLTFQF